MINSNYLEKKSILLNQPYLINGIEIFCDDPIKYNFLNLIQSIVNIESIKKFKFKESHNNNYYNYENINNINNINISKNFLENHNNNIQKKKNNHQNKKLNRNLSKKIFIGGISPETTKYDLFNFFSKYGEIEYCVVNTEKLTEKPRGFGFVVFHNKSSLENCLNDSLNHFINGKWVECKKANGKKENNNKTTKNFIQQNNLNNNFQLQNINKNLYFQNYNNQLNFTNYNNKYNLKENYNNNYNINNNIIKINIENLNNYINIYNLGNINKNNNDIQKDNEMNYIKKDKKNTNNKLVINMKHFTEKEINNPSKNYQKFSYSSNFQPKDKENNQLKNLYINKQFKEQISFDKYNNIKKEKTNKKSVLRMTKNNKPKYKNNYSHLKSHLSNNHNYDIYQNYFNNECNSKFNDYIHYKLFDINGEEISFINSDKYKKNNFIFKKDDNQNIRLSKSFSNNINDIFNKHNILDNEIIKYVKKNQKTYSFNSVISTDSSQYSSFKKK